MADSVIRERGEQRGAQIRNRRKPQIQHSREKGDARKTRNKIRREENTCRKTTVTHMY